MGIIQFNPMKLTTPKKKNHSKRLSYYSRLELIKFLEVAKKESLKKYAYLRVISYTGIRRAEGFALTWGDINFDSNEIRINKAISRGKNCPLYLKITKNGVIRTISIDNETIALLTKWRLEQRKSYLKKGLNTSNKKQLVFSNKDNTFIQPVQTQKWLKKVLLKNNNLPTITTHGLRHTHCSLFFEAGATIKEVQERLGHTDVKTTLEIYTHVTKKTKASTIEKFDTFMKGSL